MLINALKAGNNLDSLTAWPTLVKTAGRMISRSADRAPDVFHARFPGESLGPASSPGRDSGLRSCPSPPLPHRPSPPAHRQDDPGGGKWSSRPVGPILAVTLHSRAGFFRRPSDPDNPRLAHKSSATATAAARHARALPPPPSLSLYIRFPLREPAVETRWRRGGDAEESLSHAVGPVFFTPANAIFQRGRHCCVNESRGH
jgi:hypothetical protein